jgi:hypothetical protein
MPKLTLNADSKTVSLAKKLAKVNQTSVSDMFCRFINGLAAGKQPDVKIGPLTRKMTGIIKLPEGQSEQEVLTDALMDKYGVKK